MYHRDSPLVVALRFGVLRYALPAIAAFPAHIQGTEYHLPWHHNASRTTLRPHTDTVGHRVPANHTGLLPIREQRVMRGLARLFPNKLVDCCTIDSAFFKK